MFNKYFSKDVRIVVVDVLYQQISHISYKKKVFLKNKDDILNNAVQNYK